MEDKRERKIGRIFWYIGVSFLCCISTTIIMICKWAKGTFNVGLNAIMNTLFSPLKGTSSDTVLPAVKYCLPIVLLAVLVCVIYIIWDRKYGNKVVRRIVTLISILSIAAAFIYVQTSYDVIGYVVSLNEDTNFYKQHYVEPYEVTIHEPEEKRNLLYIYLESMETTYADKASGGIQEVNYMPYATQLANENITFGDADRAGGVYPVEGALWTMGALFASSSGLPFAFPVGTNGMENETVFASGAYTMGDFLKEQGYVQEFLCGSDAIFAGRKSFFEQHGSYEIFDLHTAREKGYIPEDYFVWWGFEDYILYEIAKDELLRLSEGEQPFNLTMLTVDPHHIGGYQCKLCGNEYEDVTANVIACADRQLETFIEWCKQQEFYENTTIVIVGDHPRMDTHLVGDLNTSERALYNCFINAVWGDELEDRKRQASLLDMFPTVLTALGYEIEGNKLGLGVNLFSEEETVIEQFGLEEINKEFLKRSSYYVERFSPELAHLVADEKDAICTVHFGGEEYNAGEYIREGISEVEKIYSWIEGKKMVVGIPVEEDVDKVHITIHIVSTVRNEYYYVTQESELLCEGHQDGPGTIEFDANVENGMCNFIVNIPHVESPYAYGMSEDTRAISLKLSHMTVNFVEEK